MSSDILGSTNMTPERKCVRFKYQNNEDHPNTPKRKKGGKLASHHTSFHYLLPLLLLLTYLPLSSCLSDPVISSPYAVLEGGKNATLTCTLSSANLSTTSYPLIWRRDIGLPAGSSAQNYPWDSNTNTYRTELTFAPTALDNEVSIICLVFDGTDTKTASYQVSVILVPQTPNITGNLTARADVVDIWTCVVDGASYIPPNVYWRDGNGLSLTNGVNKNTIISLVSNNNYVYKVTSTYTAALPAQSTYTLTCYVVHQMDNYYNIMKQSSININVVYPPTTTAGSLAMTVNENTRVIIVCNINSNPPATTVTWTKDGVTVSGERYESFNASFPNLIIKNVSVSDAGRYNCTASNSLGSGSFDVPTTLTVNYAPVIRYNITSFTGNVGSSIVLPCPVNALPEITTIRWKRYDAGQVTTLSLTSSKYSGADVTNKDYGLKIQTLQESDAGIYFCEAGNTLGTGTGSNLTLTVTSFPVISPPTTTNLTGIESQQTTLECNVTPLDSLTDLYWTRNGQRLNTSNSTKYQGGTTTRPNLTILYLTDTDTGIYACVANNSFGPTQGPNSSLNIFYKPKLTVVRDPISSNAGFDVSLTCSISANPAITSFNWTKIGVGAINSSTNTSKYAGGTTFNPTLTIHLLSAQDSGNYTCGAANSIGSTVSSVVVLNVISSPLVTVSPTSDTKPEGTPEFVLSCTVLAIPAIKNLTWQKDSAVINLTGQSSKYSGGVISQPNLTIKNLTRYDAGVYVCQATNDNGPGQSAGAQLNVTFQPTISGGPGSVQAADDKNVTLTCSVASYPPLTSLYWTKDEVPINTTQNPNKYSGGTVSVPDLTIIKLNKTTDVGSYKCVARNSVGNTTSPAVNLTITYDPYISVNQTSITAEEGKPFTIFINEVKIYPSTAGVTWFKDGQQINLDANRNKYTGGILNSSSLTVLNASKSDSGTYKLQATNGSKTVDSPTITVSVIYPPKVSGNSSTETTSGATISLMCSVDAIPSITSLSWTKTVNGVSAAVVYDARLSGGNVTNPDLKIAGVTPSDAGSYRCVAGNTLGNTTGPTSIITVKYKPTVEVRTSPTSVVVGQRMDLLCTVTAYPAASRVSWSKVETGTEVSTTSTYVIRNATYTDYMEYRCSATNTEGTSSATIKPNITFNPQQSGTGEETVQTNVPADLTLECTVVANPEPTSYSWFNGTNLMPQYTQKTITLRITSASDYGVYSCSANNSLGGLNPARTFTVTNKGTTGSSTGSSGLSTATIILIVIIIVILLIIIILLLIFCCLQGVFAKCCKKKESGKVAPVNGSAPPMKAALSNPIFASDPKLRIDDDVPRTSTSEKPSVIISVPAPDGAKPHHLPPLDPIGEKATEKFYRDQIRRSRKKKKERKQENNEDEKALTGNGTDGSTPSLEKIGVSTA